MDKKAEQTELKQQIKTVSRRNDTYLLQTAVVFLAVVSFFTTANGMKQYIFTQHGTIAYTASAAIQGILLALSMNLPGYLRGILEGKRAWYAKFLLTGAAIVLTGVAIFCSSWFSYVYIAGVIHQDSWGTDSELLVQQTYRSELYAARDYAHTYRIYLEEDMGEKILLLEHLAKDQLSNSMIDFEITWDTERQTYSNIGGTTASYMLPVIDAMSKASGDSTGESRDLAAKAVEDAQNNIAMRMENIRQRTATVNQNLTNYNTYITNLTNRIRNAQEGTDVASLTNSLNNYTWMIENATQELTDLDLETAQLDSALTRLSVYESLLGLNSSTSAISIRSALMEMQSEFFQQEPNEERLLEIATDIFDNLRNASAAETSADDALSYTSLLVQMNQLIRNLTEYSEIKNIELDLENLISELRISTQALGTEGSDPAGAPDSSSEPGDSSVADNSSNNRKQTHDDSQWKRLWGERLAELKAQISAMPVYSPSENTGGEAAGVLSQSQLNILQSYDRDASSKALDDIIRRYISNHNAIYQGIIYLQSPYRALALFALVLAFSFDLAGFVFGVVIEGNPRENPQEDSQKDSSKSSQGNPPGKYTPLKEFVLKNTEPKAAWSILNTMCQYYVLTGDYERKDGVYYYKVFRNGLLEEWPVESGNPFDLGIYQQFKKDGIVIRVPIGWQEQMLCFADQRIDSERVGTNIEAKQGAQDGIYLGGKLIYNEGSLIRVTGDRRDFIACLEEYVPIHSYDPKKGENWTIPAKKLTKELKIKVAVVALNDKGTRIAAIYVIENSI